ncbi:uroporphyrinogen-III synthase [Arthrobacter sp. CAN_A6]|uniref:uroporphyrinogen-III synthase n=1 Tax=Arthrobacter sp. CAN_A6 TaxID=2787721 RepID=UPI0018C99D7A
MSAPAGGEAPISNRQLEGFRIGVTSDRRSADLIEALERRGAQVLHAPALKIAPIAEDVSLLADTRAMLSAQPDLFVITTAYGMRRWFEAADAAGLGDSLLEILDAGEIYVRGPKARGAVRAAGLTDAGISHDETTATLVDMLLQLDLTGLTIGVQLHGYADVHQLERLRAAGARILTVTPYRWIKPEGADRLPRLIEAACAGQLDCVTFTSAPAVDALFSTAAELGLLEALTNRFRNGLVAAAVGPVTAQPLLDAGIEPLVPERFRMGALIRMVCEHLAEHQVKQLQTRSGLVEIRGRAVIVGDVRIALAPAQLLLLKALLTAGGAVVGRTALAGILATGGADHALEMSVNRLRKSLPDPTLVETVIKRGYRLGV